MALRAKIDAAVTCPAVHPATRRGRAAEAPTRRGRAAEFHRRHRTLGEARATAGAVRNFPGGGCSLARNFLSHRALARPPQIQLREYRSGQRAGPFLPRAVFSAAAGDAETGARAPYRRFLGRAAFLALLLEML